MPFSPLAGARRRLVQRLEREGALSPETAKSLAGLTGLELGRLTRLLEVGAIHEAAPGSYWLDRERYVAYDRHHRRVAILVVLAVLVALFFVVELSGRP